MADWSPKYLDLTSRSVTTYHQDASRKESQIHCRTSYRNTKRTGREIVDEKNRSEPPHHIFDISLASRRLYTNGESCVVDERGSSSMAGSDSTNEISRIEETSPRLTTEKKETKK
ncbi:unnamed protein product [Arabis nemorensis]|uniref:Uncharacterized protein n=1 Tax=Arabis nemorensis TaxID=586526 RepID=A0A565CV37_9BRAS|nr:unnamed protein product [Arabis nemorensis]